jgi:mono/diheme cytochrome c family protein
MKKLISLSALGAALALGAPALAEERPVDLKDAPGKEVVEGACAACHSLDYIEMNSPFLDARKWEATVTKMVKAFGAPIGEEDARKITEYLSRNYGDKP